MSEDKDYHNHERIWLEPVEPIDPVDGRQWCRDNVWGNGIEYIRADLVADKIAEAKRLQDAINLKVAAIYRDEHEKADAEIFSLSK